MVHTPKLAYAGLTGEVVVMRAMLLAALVLCAPTQTIAAPFCAVFSYGKQCYYFTYDACMRAAGTSGACIANPDEARAPAGGGGAPFCVVSAFGTQCNYYDANSCRQAAASSGGACAVNPRR
jgi:hypothetical protein